MKTLVGLSFLIIFLIAAVSLAACGSQSQGGPDQAVTGDPAVGKELFTTCQACHGVTGEGVPGLGNNLTTSEFVAGKGDAELVEFIKVGRDANDPLNTSGIMMPPKGSNPGLSEQDLFDIVAYIRTIQE